VLLIVAAQAVLQGDARRALVALAAAALVLRGTGANLIALVGCLLLGEWAAASATGLALLGRGLDLALLVRPRKLDLDALSAAVGVLPRSLHDQLRSRAGEGPITTWHAVDLARANAPGAWQALLGPDLGGTGFDGPILTDPHGGTCTQFFAEAAGCASELAGVAGQALGIDALAVAAGVIIPSLGSEWVRGNAAERILRMSEREMLEGIVAFGRTPAAAGLLTRAELMRALPAALTPSHGREQLAGLTRKEVVAAQVRYRLLFIGALGAVARDGLRSLRLRPRRRREQAQTAKQDTQAKSSAHRSARPRPRSGARLLLKPPAAWNVLPGATRVAWLLMRPALGLAAVAAVALTGHVRWWAILIAAVSVLFFRGLRSPLPSLLAAAALIAASLPIAGTLLAARTLVGEVSLLAVGTGTVTNRRASGLARVFAARRQLVGIDRACGSYEEANARFLQLAAQPTIDHDEIFGAGATRLLAAWSEARPLLAARAALSLFKGAALGRWESQTGPGDFAGEFRRLFIRETVGPSLLRLVLAVLAAAATTVAVGPVPWALGTHGAVALLPPLAAALAIVVPAGRSRPSWTLSALAVAAVWLALEDQATTIIAISASCAVATHLLRRSFERATLTGPDEDPWMPARKMSRKARELWLAADEAAAEGRTPLAVEMLDELAHREATGHPELADECHARIALWQLEDGRVGEAATRLDMIAQAASSTATTDQPRMSAAGNFAAGVLSSHLGDDPSARDRLKEALKQAAGRPALARRIALPLAEVHARLSDPAAALRVLEDNPLPRVGSAGMAMVIDREVVIASALDRAGERDAALERVAALTTIGFSGDVDPATFGKQTVQRISSAEGRANLLGGRLRLEADEPIEARPLLANAATLLARDTDAYLRASAEVLLGRTLTAEDRHEEATAAIQAGLDVLEGRRGQLSSAERRTAMIVAGEGVYEHALTAFEQADRFGLAGAGTSAFALIESLRRNAISSMLRRPQDDFREQLNARLGESHETRDGAEDELNPQARLAQLVPEQFAQAFEPSPVDPAELRAAARANGHLLAFYVAPSGGSTWCAWMRPEGTAQVRRIAAGDDPEHPLARLREGASFAEPEIHGPWDDCGTVWRDLADALLPEDLRGVLSEASAEQPLRMLVVPDGYLAGIPWGALNLFGAPLVTRALVQVTPTVDLAGTGRARARRPRAPVIAFAPPTAVGLLERSLPVAHASGLGEFLAALDSEGCGGAYIGTHGEATGLDQRVQLGEEDWLSAADALMHPWPDWVIFAACVVGRINPRAGGEPLGLPISCMLGGSTSVLAAVVRITGARADEAPAATSELFATAGKHLSDGVEPAHALRAAQLAYLDSSGDMATVGDGLGAVCISTQTLASAPAT
jgi:hypothetical protein